MWCTKTKTWIHHAQNDNCHRNRPSLRPLCPKSLIGPHTLHGVNIRLISSHNPWWSTLRQNMRSSYKCGIMDAYVNHSPDKSVNMEMHCIESECPPVVTGATVSYQRKCSHSSTLELCCHRVEFVKCAYALKLLRKVVLFSLKLISKFCWLIWHCSRQWATRSIH